MSLTDKSTDAISDQLFSEKKPITYKVLSRKLGISNHESKSLLKQYYDKYKDERTELQPTYILIGMHQHVGNEEDEGDYGEDNGSVLIRLCKKQGLEDAKKEFSEVQSCFIYSLSDGDIPFDNIAAVNDTVEGDASKEKMGVYGVLQTPTAGVLSSKEKAKIVLTTKDLSAKKLTEPKAEAFGVEKQVQKAKKEEPQKDPFALYHSRKRDTKKRSETSVDSIRQKDFEQSHKRQAAARNKAKVFSRKQQQHEEELSKMFSDDEDKTSKRKEGATKTIPIEVDTSEMRSSEKEESDAEQEESLEGEVINDFLSKSTQKAETGNKDDAVKTYVDKDGYMVTVKDDSKNKAKSRSSKRTKRKAEKPKNHVISEESSSRKRKKKSSAKQTSLMSFFGKKR